MSFQEINHPNQKPPINHPPDLGLLLRLGLPSRVMGQENHNQESDLDQNSVILFRHPHNQGNQVPSLRPDLKQDLEDPPLMLIAMRTRPLLVLNQYTQEVIPLLMPLNMLLELKGQAPVFTQAHQVINLKAPDLALVLRALKSLVEVRIPLIPIQ